MTRTRNSRGKAQYPFQYQCPCNASQVELQDSGGAVSYLASWPSAQLELNDLVLVEARATNETISMRNDVAAKNDVFGVPAVWFKSDYPYLRISVSQRRCHRMQHAGMAVTKQPRNRHLPTQKHTHLPWSQQHGGRRITLGIYFVMVV